MSTATISRKKHFLVLCSAALLVAACGSSPDKTSTPPSGEFDAESYFGSRDVTFVVTHSEGGGTGLTASVFAGALSELLPGKPKVRVTYVSGQEGMGLVYGAPESELLMGVTSQASGLFEPVLDPEVEFDPTKVSILGGVVADPRSGIGVGDFAKAYKSLTEAKDGDVPLKAAYEVGSPVDVTAEAMTAPFLCDTFGIKCDLSVVSADSTADVELMMARGEVNFDVRSLGSAARVQNDALVAGTSKLYYTIDAKDADISWPSEIKAPPHLEDMLPADRKEQFELLKPLITSGGIQRIMYVGPNVPEGAVEAMRAAWDTYIADKDLFAEYSRVLRGEGGTEEEAGLIAIPVLPLTGQESQDQFAPQAEEFVANADKYPPIQEDIFDRYFSAG